MIKWAMNAECSFGCEYCVMRNVHVKESTSLLKTARTLKFFGVLDKKIMITGGEPLQSNVFKQKLRLACQYFDEVYLTTAVHRALKGIEGVDAITFSLHGRRPDLFNHIEEGVTVYGSILAHQYFPALPWELRSFGWAGLTINEDHRMEYGGRFDEGLLPEEMENFTIRINRAGSCIDEEMLFPDLKWRLFSPWLYRGERVRGKR